MILPCREKILHHLWLCRSRIGDTEVNLILVHNAAAEWRYKWYLQKQYPLCLSRTHLFPSGKSKRAVRGYVSRYTPFLKLLYDSLAKGREMEREREMAKVWHTRLTACQCPPARITHTTEVYGGGQRRISLLYAYFLSFVIISSLLCVLEVEWRHFE